MTPSIKKSIEPIRKSLDLDCDIHHAFEVFTRKMTLWWPLKVHSCGEENAESVRMEERVGGKIIETEKNGTTHIWGEVLQWDPPYHFAMTWHPANPSTLATKVTVSFEKLGERRSRLKILHEGWEIRGIDGEKIRGGYHEGWDEVLALYRSALT